MDTRPDSRTQLSPCAPSVLPPIALDHVAGAAVELIRDDGRSGQVIVLDG